MDINGICYQIKEINNGFDRLYFFSSWFILYYPWNHDEEEKKITLPLDYNSKNLN